MMEEQAMTAVPAFEFHVRGTSISGHVTAQTVEEAKSILNKIHLGHKTITKTIDGVDLVEAVDFMMATEPVRNKVFQISYVNGE